MKRLAIVVVTIIITTGSLQAQDVKQLADEVKKMRQQILTQQSKLDFLERNVTELREKLNAVSGFTQSGGNYILNAAGGSVTIKANTLVFESTGGISLKAESNATLQSGSALSLKSGGNASIESSRGSLTLTGLRALLQSHGDLTLKAHNGVFEASGSIDVKASSDIDLKAGNPFTLKGNRLSSSPN